VQDDLVSVVMPARNAARTIGAALASVQNQTDPRWELIVVDDGSADATAALVEQLAGGDSRIRLLRNAVGVGPGPARNRAIGDARGRWLAFLDSDDLWEPAKLERQLAFMQARGAALGAHAYRTMTDEGTLTGGVVVPPERVTFELLLRNTIVGMLTVMIDRTRVAGLELPALRQHEDLLLWYRLLRRGWVFHGLAEPLATYRIARRSASGDKLRSAHHMWQVYRRHLGLGLAETLACFPQYAWHAWRKHRGRRA
jgi:teichuronic acid biosynthesis glycosyltransferase TuaG